MRAAAYALIAIAPLALTAAPGVAAAKVFDMDRARAFCAAGEPAELEECLADQERAGQWIDRFLTSGPFPRYSARRAYIYCDQRYGPDLRHAKLCLEDIEDNRRNGDGLFGRR